MENIVIIGAGPAGISAALYAARGNMNPLVINNGIGALEKAEKIENYYGLEQPLSGKESTREGYLRRKPWECVSWMQRSLGSVVLIHLLSRRQQVILTQSA